MKKKQGILAAWMIMFALLTGCGGSGDKQKDQGFVPSLDTSQSAEFTIVGDMNNFEALEAVIGEFKKVYPNVNITYEKMDDYSKMLETRLKNDASVGCFMGGGSEELSVELYGCGYNTDAFGPIIKANIKEGGHLYSIPMGLNISGLVVNADLLKKEGLEVPTNYAEFTAVCDALVAKGYTPIQQQNAALCRYLFEPCVWAQIVSSGDVAAMKAELSSGKKGSMECMRPVFELYDTFVEKKYIDPAINATIQDNYDAAILHFFEGDVPFMPAIGDTVSGMKKRESKSESFSKAPFEYYFIYAPLGDDGVYSHQQVWKSLSASKYSDHQELAVEFLKFLGTVDNLNLLAQTKGIPSAAKVTTDARFANINDAKGLHIYLWEYDIPYDVWNPVIGWLIEYANGTVSSVDEALSLAEQDNANLAK